MSGRAHLHAPTDAGARLADSIARLVGSWRFIVGQTVLVALWVAGNGMLLDRPFDPFPFILLNLAFSTQAAYTGPILLLASNRQAAKDRAIATRDDQEIGQILADVRDLKVLVDLLVKGEL